MALLIRTGAKRKDTLTKLNAWAARHVIVGLRPDNWLRALEPKCTVDLQYSKGHTRFACHVAR